MYRDLRVHALLKIHCESLTRRICYENPSSINHVSWADLLNMYSLWTIPESGAGFGKDSISEQNTRSWQTSFTNEASEIPPRYFGSCKSFKCFSVTNYLFTASLSCSLFITSVMALLEWHGYTTNMTNEVIKNQKYLSQRTVFLISLFNLNRNERKKIQNKTDQILSETWSFPELNVRPWQETETTRKLERRTFE